MYFKEIIDMQVQGLNLFKPYVSVANALVLVAIIYLSFLFELNGSTMAAWVQAVGSVAAILVATEVASRQSREQTEAVRIAKVVVCDGLMSLTQRAIRVGEGLSQPSAPDSIKMSLGLYAGLRKSFEEVDILALPSPDLIDPVCTIRDSLLRLEENIGAAISGAKIDHYLLDRKYAIDVALILCARDQIIAARARFESKAIVTHVDAT